MVVFQLSFHCYVTFPPVKKSELLEPREIYFMYQILVSEGYIHEGTCASQILRFGELFERDEFADLVYNGVTVD